MCIRDSIIRAQTNRRSYVTNDCIEETHLHMPANRYVQGLRAAEQFRLLFTSGHTKSVNWHNLVSSINVRLTETNRV